jgi:hypothetical protein
VTWFKVDDGITFHRKVIAAGNEAMGAWMRAGAWSSANLTEGFIPPDVCKVIAPPKVWAKLRAASLTEAPADGGKGEQIHDFLAYNPTASEVRAARSATASRVQKFRAARRASGGDVAGKGAEIEEDNGVCNGVTPPVTNGVRTPAPIPIPIPIPIPDPDPECLCSAHAREHTREDGEPGGELAVAPPPERYVEPDPPADEEPALDVEPKPVRLAPPPPAARAEDDGEDLGRLAVDLEAEGSALGKSCAARLAQGGRLTEKQIEALRKIRADRRTSDAARAAVAATRGEADEGAAAVWAEYLAAMDLRDRRLVDAPSRPEKEAAREIWRAAEKEAERQAAKGRRSWNAPAIVADWIRRWCDEADAKTAGHGWPLPWMRNTLTRYGLDGRRPPKSTAVQQLAAKRAPVDTTPASSRAAGPAQHSPACKPGRCVCTLAIPVEPPAPAYDAPPGGDGEDWLTLARKHARPAPVSSLQKPAGPGEHAWTAGEEFRP